MTKWDKEKSRAMKKIILKTAVLLVAAALICLAGCQNQKGEEKEGGHEQRTGTQEQKAEQQAPKGPEFIFGTVKEAMNSGGYTYVLLEFEGKQTWVAMPETSVSVGDELMLQPGDVMHNFHSKTLNRTFETIIFSPGPMTRDSAEGAKDKGKKAAASAHKASAHTGSPRLKKAVTEPMAKAKGDNAVSVQEAYSRAKELDGKRVKVRGQVVKVSANIMGKNWVHIQDGTGDVESGDFDLTVTTKDMPEVGDVVIAEGTLHADKDFGAGYFYRVIVEDASVKGAN